MGVKAKVSGLVVAGFPMPAEPHFKAMWDEIDEKEKMKP